MESNNICKIMVDPAQLQHELNRAYDDAANTGIYFERLDILLMNVDAKIAELEKFELLKDSKELTVFIDLIRDQIFEINQQN